MRDSPTKTPQLRLRIFAGPNGSGKSTVIDRVRQYTQDNHPIDFGIYINADDIVQHLLYKHSLDFADYKLKVTPGEFYQTSIQSGLIGDRFTDQDFRASYSLSGNILELKLPPFAEALAQVVAEFLRQKLLKGLERFSFETVFSHRSKLDMMQTAADMGYKVYLYFVSTESADINVFRVKSRAADNGHDVPEDTIRSRYDRSLGFLYEACQIAYQVYFFDNSKEGREPTLFAHFKNVRGIKKWDAIDPGQVPVWFLKYYTRKIPQR